MVQRSTETASPSEKSVTSLPASNIRPALNKGEQIHHFDDGDEKIAVLVTEHYRNEFTAIDAENYDYDSPVGYGDTTMSAIADLFEKRPRAASEREERDHMAARFDRAQDYRKHSHGAE